MNKLQVIRKSDVNKTGKEYQYLSIVLHTDVKDYELGRLFIDDKLALGLDGANINVDVCYETKTEK